MFCWLLLTASSVPALRTDAPEGVSALRKTLDCLGVAGLKREPEICCPLAVLDLPSGGTVNRISFDPMLEIDDPCGLHSTGNPSCDFYFCKCLAMYPTATRRRLSDDRKLVAENVPILVKTDWYPIFPNSCFDDLCFHCVCFV